MKPIETHIFDCRFRSRLEARWAIFFTEIGLKWLYEPQGFELDNRQHYLPDFFFPELQSFAEVKPDLPGGEELSKIVELGQRFRILLLTGLPSNEPMKLYSPDEEESDSLMQFYRDVMIENGHTVRYWRFWWTNEGQNDQSYLFREAAIKAKKARFEYDR